MRGAPVKVSYFQKKCKCKSDADAGNVKGRAMYRVPAVGEMAPGPKCDACGKQWKYVPEVFGGR